MSHDAIGRPMEILLIEDSLMAARLATGALSKSGLDHRLTWLSDGQEARSFLLQSGKYTRAPRPDLILLDLHLPEVDGTTLLREIREKPALKMIPIVIMTGTAGEKEITEIESLDVQGFLVKPVDLTQFLKLVETLKGYWKTDMIVKG
ncbi:response regulator [Planctomicrobium piriforme]|uniref:Response regulator receiver domain-containing protein n=1 Tax=Planctomicrobium piriforme TaxID=1576369 RepID=A0A1I3BD39_9PLAN|nr:response regulator [Planctomicrobium piriforme]SFH60202.1 Response regulator receiver domain-containing protein [Planctomicrobium piriforme]